MTQITLVVLSNELLDFRTQVGQYGEETVGSGRRNRRPGDGRLSEKSFVTLENFPRLSGRTQVYIF
jgi:hypothetical protein